MGLDRSQGEGAETAEEKEVEVGEGEGLVDEEEAELDDEGDCFDPVGPIPYAI